MACNEEFCTNYMVINLEKATLFDLVCILCSHDFEKISSVDVSESEKLGGLRLRWLIFISVFFQKILLSLKNPLARFGFLIEWWLNLPSSNGGVTQLILNGLQGKVVTPDRLSARFRSFVGNLDKRVELDSSIGMGNSRYSAALSMMAAKLSYENEAFAQSVIADHWKMKFLGFYKFYNGKKITNV